MGYTHYYTRPYRLRKDLYLHMLEDVKTLYARLPEYSDTAGGYATDQKIEICGWDGTGSPQFTVDTIRFNGNAHQLIDGIEEDLAHETFVLERAFQAQSYDVKDHGLWFSFCKTARKPYDLLVCGTLMLLKHYFPKCKISSDGEYHDWMPAIIWYQSVFPERGLPENGPWQHDFVEQEAR